MMKGEAEDLLERFRKDPAVAEILEAKTRSLDERRREVFSGADRRAAERDLKALQAHARVKRSYALDEALLPAGEVPPPTGVLYTNVPLGQSWEPVRGVPAEYVEFGKSGSGTPSAPPKTFEEGWENYRGALYAIGGVLSAANSLLHNEIMRTPRGGVAWKNLDALTEKLGEVSAALRVERDRVPEGNGLVE